MRLQKKNILTVLAALSITVCSGVSAPRSIQYKSSAWVPLNNIASYYGMKSSQPTENPVRLRNRWHTLEFETDSRHCRVNGTLLWLNHPVRKTGGRWSLKEPDFSKTVDPAIRPYAFLKRAGNRIVVLDPGHGGRDKGAVSPRRIYEKLLTKNIANRVREQLQKKGITVYLTRETDTFLPLSDRTKIAAKHNADIFVSLHADSADASAEGAGTFVLSLPGEYSTHGYGRGTPSNSRHPGNRYDPANQALGARIQEHLVESTGQKDRGVKRARFKVLREAPCPAALVEMAFITNPKEERFVLSEKGQDQIARGIAGGITAYCSDVTRARR